MACLGACSPEQATYGDFRSLNNDWDRNTSLVFHPTMPDSAATYTITLAIRNTNLYPYATLPLAVDLAGTDSVGVKRFRLEIPITDASGEWLGAGFGTFFQHKQVVTRSATAAQVAKVIVWQTVDSIDALPGIDAVGIIVSPNH